MSARQWKHFGSKVRPGREDLLKRLPDFPGAILVAGCQRSGGTMLAKAMSQHEAIAEFSWSKDAELDAAQLLSGAARTELENPQGKRLCFQTTYINERYVEYPEHHESSHLIWLIRNPHSVVYSMLHNWKRFALNEVFLSCGRQLLPSQRQKKLQRFGIFAVPPVERACYAYLGKLQQASELLNSMPHESFTTCEYEELVSNKPVMLERLFDFVGLKSAELPIGGEISTRSLNKADGLKANKRTVVDELCLRPYQEFRSTSIRLRSN